MTASAADYRGPVLDQHASRHGLLQAPAGTQAAIRERLRAYKKP
jgi:hypothetical protein